MTQLKFCFRSRSAGFKKFLGVRDINVLFSLMSLHSMDRDLLCEILHNQARLRTVCRPNTTTLTFRVVRRS
jgi:hypothetical protein